MIYFYIVNDKLLEKYKTISTKIEDYQNIELNALLVYDDWYSKTKVRTYGRKAYTNFYNLNVSEDGAEC